MHCQSPVSKCRRNLPLQGFISKHFIQIMHNVLQSSLKTLHVHPIFRQLPLYFRRLCPFHCDGRAVTGCDKDGVYFLARFGTVWSKYIRTPKGLYHTDCYYTKIDCEKDTAKTRRMFSYEHHASVSFKVTEVPVLVLRYYNYSFAYSRQNSSRKLAE